MVFLELTKKRYSVRSYTSQEVEKSWIIFLNAPGMHRLP